MVVDWVGFAAAFLMLAGFALTAMLLFAFVIPETRPAE